VHLPAEASVIKRPATNEDAKTKIKIKARINFLVTPWLKPFIFSPPFGGKVREEGEVVKGKFKKAMY